MSNVPREVLNHLRARELSRDETRSFVPLPRRSPEQLVDTEGVEDDLEDLKPQTLVGRLATRITKLSGEQGG